MRSLSRPLREKSQPFFLPPESVPAAASENGVASGSSSANRSDAVSVHEGATEVPALPQEAELDVLHVTTVLIEVCLDLTQTQHTGYAKRIISPIP